MGTTGSGAAARSIGRVLTLLAGLGLLAVDAVSDGGVTLRPRLQAGLIANDSASKNVFPSGFLAFDEGFNLNRAELLL